jgi:hypothetical protein
MLMDDRNPGLEKKSIAFAALKRNNPHSSKRLLNQSKKKICARVDTG